MYKEEMLIGASAVSPLLAKVTCTLYSLFLDNPIIRNAPITNVNNNTNNLPKLMKLISQAALASFVKVIN